MKLSRLIYTLIVYFFLYFPIAVLVIFSFNSASYSLVWHGFSLKWYSALLQDKFLLTVAWHSLMIGVIAAISAAILGTLAAFTLFRYQFFGKKFMHGLIFTLILIPDIVLAVAFIIFYKVVSIPLGFFTLIMAHITFCMPFVSVIVYSRLASSDRMIFEAAKDLGASDLTVFLKITIPLMLPAIIAGMLLSFTLSIDDVIISYFVTGPSFQILPLTIYSMVRVGVTPEINALCSLILLVTFTAAGISQLLIRNQTIKKFKR